MLSVADSLCSSISFLACVVMLPSTSKLPVTVTLLNVLVPAGAVTFAFTVAPATVDASSITVPLSLDFTSPLNQASPPVDPASRTL